ncbi:MAG: hypothetical protein HYU75_11605 [Betaproteobacteria bacterium]|nr:hypothetical protein [Betaproteobacteria bacterium]
MSRTPSDRRPRGERAAFTHVVEHEEDGKGHQRSAEQHHERLLALAGEHPIEHLHGEDRRNEKQQVDEE